MERWKTEYHNIQVPKEVREKMEEAIKRAQESKKKAKKAALSVICKVPQRLLRLYLSFPIQARQLPLLCSRYHF